MIPDPLLRSAQATTPRTLVDIVDEQTRLHPDALAVDSGVDVLTYDELREAALVLAGELADRGIGSGDRVGIRMKSGTTDLYVAILGVLQVGACYVPVDADDPDERARVVFAEADVAAVIGNDLAVADRRTGSGTRDRAEDPRPAGPTGPHPPSPGDDAWVIFTSGSTGTPKGVAVTHRNAAAFVDAESTLFLQEQPIGPGDRVMAGLSVAFDASCEEIWLAWAHGACLVPAPRSLVRSGVEVGPWLVANRITVVSTVPTLVALWPEESLATVRLLILGGEAFPPELVDRLQAPGREVWNTYGPTEATVVACGALTRAGQTVRIGLPLIGWDLAVVDGEGHPVPEGGTGELIIGGVGLARYLDPAKDAEKYAPMPTLGWERAYRSGDLVVNDPQGLLFAGRADDQIKLGGRRIELGEIDEQLLRVPGVVAAAAAVRSSKAGNQVLIGYLAVTAEYDAAAALDQLRDRLPAALVPRLAVVDSLPTKTSGKVDREALPWPLPRAAGGPDAGFDPTQRLLADLWAEVLGAEATSVEDDFFDFGGGSLTAAQLVSRLRTTFPDIAVGDVYAHPTIVALAGYLDELGGTAVTVDRHVQPIRPKTQVGQLLALVPLWSLAGLRWCAWILLGSRLLGWPWLPQAPWPVIVVLALVFSTPPGRMALGALLARIVLRQVTPGAHPRGGKIHLRIWLADRIQDRLGTTGLSGTAFFTVYARLLGCRIGAGVDLHTVPPVTGFLRVGDDAAIEPEVDLSGVWIDGDVVLVGEVRVGARARVGARSQLGPGAWVHKDAEVAPGSFVSGEVPAAEFWSGAPAERLGEARGPWSDQAPPRGSRWLAAYAVVAMLLASIPGAALAAGGLVLAPQVHDATSVGAAWRAALAWVPLAAIAGYAVLAVLIWATVRLCGLLIQPGHHPVRSARGVAIWTTMRALDEARTWLFGLYSGALTPVWLRLLGARIGAGVEASTVLMIPKLTQVNDHAFLADDTLIGPYELGGGWIRVERVKIGKRAFVGNSGMTAPGRRVPKQSLVAVLSAAPERQAAKPGTSWMGSPPTKLRRTGGQGDESRTYTPPTRLRVLRALVETGRLVPMLVAVLLWLLAGGLLVGLLARHWWVGLLLAGLVLAVAATVAALVAVLAKWLFVGRHRVGEHPLWSGFVWRNELADTFTEVIAAPWFAAATQGTPALNLWLRLLGARIGRGVWCDTYWLPEPDLIELADGATVNHGCVVQTHLFHDRVLSMDRVVLKAGATLGPNGVILPAATIGRHATVGPMSLVMRGEAVPNRTRWLGNPIGPWEAAE